jgi:hypothetical protein
MFDGFNLTYAARALIERGIPPKHINVVMKTEYKGQSIGDFFERAEGLIQLNARIATVARQQLKVA